MVEDTSRKSRHQARFPKPDRTGLRRNFVKTEDVDYLDVGWDNGVLRDSRPYFVEMWCQDQISMLTFFWSSVGQENATSEELGQLLVNDGILRFAPEKHYVAARRFVDPSHHDMWSVNIGVGDDEDTFVVEDPLQLKPYR